MKGKNDIKVKIKTWEGSGNSYCFLLTIIIIVDNLEGGWILPCTETEIGADVSNQWMNAQKTTECHYL